MQHIWSVLCRNTQIDIDTNNLSINNVFEQLVATVDQKSLGKFPETIDLPLEYEVVSFWVKENSMKKIKAEIMLDIVDPQEKILKSFTQIVEIPETTKRVRTRFRIQGLGLTTSGIYEFIVKIKEENSKEFRIVSEVPLEVNLNKNPSKSIKH